MFVCVWVIEFALHCYCLSKNWMLYGSKSIVSGTFNNLRPPKAGHWAEVVGQIKQNIHGHCGFSRGSRVDSSNSVSLPTASLDWQIGLR